MEANLESLKGLEKNLKEQGYDIDKLPIVLQWNKRDLPNTTPEDELQKQLNKWNFPSFSATATSGNGVFDALKMVSKMVLMNLKGGLK